MTDPKKKREIGPEYREFATLMLEAMDMHHTIEQRGDKAIVTLDFDDLTRIVLEMHGQHGLLHNVRSHLSHYEPAVQLADNIDRECDSYKERIPTTQRMQEFNDRQEQKARETVTDEAAGGLGDFLKTLGIVVDKPDSGSMN